MFFLSMYTFIKLTMCFAQRNSLPKWTEWSEDLIHTRTHIHGLFSEKVHQGGWPCSWLYYSFVVNKKIECWWFSCVSCNKYIIFKNIITRVVMIRYPHDTIRIAILGSRYDTYRDNCWKWQNDLVNDAQRIAIVFFGNVKVRHVLCIMPSLRQLFLYRYWQNYSRLIYMVENDQNLIIVSRAE